jgi:hypothetical protein
MAPTVPIRTEAFPLLGMIAFHHSHTAERFGEPAGNVGVDFAALPENRPDGPERLTQGQREAGNHHGGDPGHEEADLEQVNQYDERREYPAGKLDEASAEEIADALHVAHDARNQYASLIGVVVGYRQTADVFLNLAPQLGD